MNSVKEKVGSNRFELREPMKGDRDMSRKQSAGMDVSQERGGMQMKNSFGISWIAGVALLVCVALPAYSAPPAPRVTGSAHLAGTWVEQVDEETKADIKPDGPPVLINVVGGYVRQCLLTRTNPRPPWLGAELMRDLSPISIVFSDQTMKLRLPKRGDLKGAFNTDTGARYDVEQREDTGYFVESYAVQTTAGVAGVHIDLSKTDKDGKKFVYKGLVQVDGDILRISWPWPDKDRPSSFPAAGCVNLIMKRAPSKKQANSSATISGSTVSEQKPPIGPSGGAENAPKPKPVTVGLPPFKVGLQGSNPVRVNNPNEFTVTVGLRLGENGVNFSVPANGLQTTHVPDGRYEIFFVYSNNTNALFQGDSFTLNGNGVEIHIVKVVNGNYGIRQVK